MSVDPTLPTFHFYPSRESPTSEATIGHSQYGSPPVPKYIKRRDPVVADRYSIALHDAYYPDIIFSSVSTPAIYPSPSLSADVHRRARSNSNTNSGAGADVEPPRIPTQLAIDLYNPSSRVILTQKPSTWASGPYWEFNIPKQSFLPPTNSKLDVSLGTASVAMAAAPVATFRWRKEGGVLSRSSLRCSLVHPNNVSQAEGGGGSSGGGVGSTSTGGRDPDITIAIFTNGLGGGKQAGKGEVTIYETNLRRVEVEDLKGLEVTLVMSAMVIADVWFGDMKTNFNLSKAPAGFSGPGRTASIGIVEQQQQGMLAPPPPASAAGPSSGASAAASPGDDDVLPAYPHHENRSSPTDTKVRPTQEQLLSSDWRHQQESLARRQREEEERQRREEERQRRQEEERRKREEQRRRREEAELALRRQEEEARRLQAQFEEEDRKERARIEAETERLRIEFEREQAAMRRRSQGGLRIQTSGFHNTWSGSSSNQNRPQLPQRQAAPGPPPRQPQNHQPPQVLQPKKSSLFGGSGGGKTLDASRDKRRSFMGLRMFGGQSSGSGSSLPAVHEGRNGSGSPGGGAKLTKKDAKKEEKRREKERKELEKLAKRSPGW